MKKLSIMFIMMFVFSFVFAQEEPVTDENPPQEVKTDTEAVKENAESAQKELTNELEPAKEEPAPAEEPERVFKSESKKKEEKPIYLEEYKPVNKEITRKWSFLPITIGLGTSLQVGFTIAQFTHKNFEIKIGSMMLGPGFRFGSKVKDDGGFVPGLSFLGEVAFGKFFGNPLKENCFGIIIGIGSKIIFDIRNIEDEWEDGTYLSDEPLYVDFLPIYLTYRWNKGGKFYDISLRIPLVWQNGVYVLTDETRLYNGVPDITLNFSFIF